MSKYNHPCFDKDYADKKEAVKQMKLACKNCDFALDGSCQEDPDRFFTSEEYLFELK